MRVCLKTVLAIFLCSISITLAAPVGPAASVGKQRFVAAVKKVIEQGKIIKVPPSKVSGPPVLSPHGGKIPHPGIVTGTKANGDVHLAPITHATDSRLHPIDDIKHHVQSKPLSGNVHLGHATANPNDVKDYPPGHPFHGSIEPHELESLKGAQERHGNKP